MHLSPKDFVKGKMHLPVYRTLYLDKLLKVLLITGSQEERRQKLDEYTSYDVLVTSYDLLKRDIVSYEDKEFLYEIIDEAQVHQEPYHGGIQGGKSDQKPVPVCNDRNSHRKPVK